jgi:hypothetical protein
MDFGRGINQSPCRAELRFSPTLRHGLPTVSSRHVLLNKSQAGQKRWEAPRPAQRSRSSDSFSTWRRLQGNSAEFFADFTPTQAQQIWDAERTHQTQENAKLTSINFFYEKMT